MKRGLIGVVVVLLLVFAIPVGSVQAAGKNDWVISKGKPTTVDEFIGYSEGVGVGIKDGKVVLLDNKFTIKKTTPYDMASICQDGRILVELYQDEMNIVYGYIDRNGKEIVKPMYYLADDFVNGYANVYNKAGQTGIINRDGKMIIPFTKNYISYSAKYDIFVALKSNSTSFKLEYIYYDKNGKKISTLPNGLTTKEFAALGTKYFNTKKMPDLITYAFCDDSIVVIRGNLITGDYKLYFYDTNGKLKSKTGFSNIIETEQKNVNITVVNGKYGISNSSGKVLLKHQYGELEETKTPGIYIATSAKTEKKGIIDEKGKKIVAFEYDEIQENKSGTGFVLEKYEILKSTYAFVDRSGNMIQSMSEMETIVDGAASYLLENPIFILYNKSVSDLKVSTTDATVKGRAVKSKVTVKDGNLTLREGIDYKLTYSNNTAVGKATVTVTGLGSYYGQKSATYRILPSKVTGLSVKKGSSTSVKVTWKKVTGATGYKVYMASSKNGTYAKVATVKGASKIAYTKTKLKKNKTYYFKVVTYQKINNEVYDSVACAPKSIKLK